MVIFLLTIGNEPINLSETDVSVSDLKYEARVSRDSLQNNIFRLGNAFLPIMHVFHQLAGEVVRLTDFSLAQYRLLMLVFRYEPLSVNELKKNLNIAQSSASEMINRLVRQKLLHREKDPADRRITRISLTPRTRKILQNHTASMQNIYRKILDPLTPKEQLQLVQAFETILVLLQKDKPQNPDASVQS